MRHYILSSVIILFLTSGVSQAQVGMPGIEYSSSIAAGDGGQLYPYDQQDPWLHGQFQRVPAYGGFASFRPYNYRHVFAQTQISSGWGAAHGMPYSHQFWNKYRGPYMQGNLHSASTMPFQGDALNTARYQPIYQAGYDASQHANGPVTNSAAGRTSAGGKSIHIFPSSVSAQ